MRAGLAHFGDRRASVLAPVVVKVGKELFAQLVAGALGATERIAGLARLPDVDRERCRQRLGRLVLRRCSFTSSGGLWFTASALSFSASV